MFDGKYEEFFTRLVFSIPTITSIIAYILLMRYYDIHHLHPHLTIFVVIILVLCVVLSFTEAFPANIFILLVMWIIVLYIATAPDITIAHLNTTTDMITTQQSSILNSQGYIDTIIYGCIGVDGIFLIMIAREFAF